MDAWSGNGWFAPVLAEIGDKMPSFAMTLFVSVFLVAVALGAARWRWWLSLPMLLLFVCWNMVEWQQLQEPHFGTTIMEEMGVGYVVGQYVGINLPVVIGAVIVVRFRDVDFFGAFRYERGEAPVTLRCCASSVELVARSGENAGRNTGCEQPVPHERV